MPKSYGHYIEASIRDGNARRDSPYTWNYTGPTILVGEFRGFYDGGFLFPSAIPAKSEIVSATLKWKTSTVNAGLNIDIYGWKDGADPKDFATGTSYSPYFIPRTSATVNWSEALSQFPNGFASKQKDVTSILQEMVNNTGNWFVDSAIGFVFITNAASVRGANGRVVAFDLSSPGDVARLEVSYNPPEVVLTPQERISTVKL